MPKCCIMPNNLKNSAIELTFPYSIAEGGGNCVPMHSNKCSEIGKTKRKKFFLFATKICLYICFAIFLQLENVKV